MTVMRRATALLLFLLLLLNRSAADSACRELDVARGWTTPVYAAEPDVTIEFFGHNFFQITSSKGTKIITDPVSPGFYPTPNVAPHAITVGREHPNHNFVEIAKNSPMVLRGLANYGSEWNKISTTVRDILVYTVPIYQQQFGNALKGAAFVFDLGTICVAHLGDLSHKLTEEQVKVFGKVDIAMIPIGGTFTMPPDTAREVLQQLKPKIAIPMHYRESTHLLDMSVSHYPSKYLNTHTSTWRHTAVPPPSQIEVFPPRQLPDYLSAP